ncbi:MAG: SIS domain-containing protein [Gemmataceae bacterium]
MTQGAVQTEIDVLREMRRVLRVEWASLAALERNLDERCVAVVQQILQCRGRVVLTGIGKAGLVARKTAATLCSTGTPAYYLNPADACHGDLGLLAPDDLLLAVSYSGESDEVLRLLPYARRLGVRVCSLTGRSSSSLARFSDVAVEVRVPREADPHDLIPTASTTALLAMGDALAVAVMMERGFSREQFASCHPGGNLGRRLLLLVRDIMHTGERLPLVPMGARVRDAIYTMTLKRLGSAFVVDAAGRLAGFFSDGDLRRLLHRDSQPLDDFIEQVMTQSPKSVRGELLAVDALDIMEEHSITVLPVLDDDGRPVGAVHLHDLVQAGLV